MSHSTGFLGLGRCPGRWRNYRKVAFGTQQQRCGKCGRVRNRKVSKCWFFHQWGRTRKDPVIRCRRCGQLKPTRREQR